MVRVTEKDFINLVTENRQRFYRIAYSYVKNEQEALDVVSESVYKGLTHLTRLNNKSYFVTWMTRIVINTSLDSIKKNNRFVAFEDYMLDEHIQESFIEDEITFDLYSAIDILPSDEKSCIILKFFEEYSYREISEILATPESTVKSKVNRALKRMKKYMKGVGED